MASLYIHCSLVRQRTRLEIFLYLHTCHLWLCFIHIMQAGCTETYNKYLQQLNGATQYHLNHKLILIMQSFWKLHKRVHARMRTHTPTEHTHCVGGLQTSKRVSRPQDSLYRCSRPSGQYKEAPQPPKTSSPWKQVQEEEQWSDSDLGGG